MLNTIEVTNVNGKKLLLSMATAGNGYAITDIEGLDPVNATITSSSFATMDGETYQSSRREKRNIVLKLDLRPEYGSMGVRELRNRLYEYFMPKSDIHLRFQMDGYDFDLDTSGRVETFESTLFSQNPQVAISIICFDPDFYNPVINVRNGDSTATSAETLFPYAGTVDTGFIFHLSVDRTISTFRLHHRASGGPRKYLDFVLPFEPLLAGDTLRISTIPGSKSVERQRNGVSTSLLYGITPGTVWPIFEPGNNYLRLAMSGTAQSYIIEYYDKYGGL